MRGRRPARLVADGPRERPHLSPAMCMPVRADDRVSMCAYVGGDNGELKQGP